MPQDARIPLILGGPDRARTGDALLAEGHHPAAAARFTPALSPGHEAGCACCGSRNAAGRALAALLQDRARGRVLFFRRVVAFTLTQAGRREVEVALESDPVASSCFRLTDGDGR